MDCNRVRIAATKAFQDVRAAPVMESAMTNRLLNIEADRCRDLARAFVGKAEYSFLMKAAAEFEHLAKRQPLRSKPGEEAVAHQQ